MSKMTSLPDTMLFISLCQHGKFTFQKFLTRSEYCNVTQNSKLFIVELSAKKTGTENFTEVNSKRSFTFESL